MQLIYIGSIRSNSQYEIKIPTLFYSNAERFSEFKWKIVKIKCKRINKSIPFPKCKIVRKWHLLNNTAIRKIAENKLPNRTVLFMMAPNRPIRIKTIVDIWPLVNSVHMRFYTICMIYFFCSLVSPQLGWRGDTSPIVLHDPHLSGRARGQGITRHVSKTHYIPVSPGVDH